MAKTAHQGIGENHNHNTSFACSDPKLFEQGACSCAMPNSLPSLDPCVPRLNRPLLPSWNQTDPSLGSSVHPRHWWSLGLVGNHDTEDPTVCSGQTLCFVWHSKPSNTQMRLEDHLPKIGRRLYKGLGGISMGFHFQVWL